MGFAVKEPDGSLLEGYILESATVDEGTKSVCLQYRHTGTNGDSLLLIAQGPLELTPRLELIPDLPEYLVSQEKVDIGGAENSIHTTGWRRSAWACSEAAEKEKTQFSYAVAPWLTWEAQGNQFDLYSASGGCETPGGMTNLDLLRLAESLTGQSTHPADELDADCLHSIADAEKMAGFDVKEPGYLPEDVSFYYATVEEAPNPTVTLLFLHEAHPDMGRFFQITQAQDAPPFFLTSCDGAGSDSCEMLQVGDTPLVYQSTAPSEQLDWQAGEYFFSLFRSAGEPGKVYKEDLLKVVDSIK